MSPCGEGVSARVNASGHRTAPTEPPKSARCPRAEPTARGFTSIRGRAGLGVSPPGQTVATRGAAIVAPGNAMVWS